MYFTHNWDVDSTNTLSLSSMYISALFMEVIEDLRRLLLPFNILSKSHNRRYCLARCPFWTILRVDGRRIWRILALGNKRKTKMQGVYRKLCLEKHHKMFCFMLLSFHLHFSLISRSSWKGHYCLNLVKVCPYFLIVLLHSAGISAMRSFSAALRVMAEAVSHYYSLTDCWNEVSVYGILANRYLIPLCREYEY